MDIPLTLRLVKGSEITYAEGDGNLVALRNAILALSAGLVISDVEQEGSKIRFVYSDGTASPQISLPTASFNPRGAWQTGLVYRPGDFVLFGHDSYATKTQHQAGVFADDVAAGKLVLFAQGGTDGSFGGIEEAPETDGPYGRMAGGWAPVVEEAPPSGKWVREAGSWAPLPSDEGGGDGDTDTTETWLYMSPTKTASTGEVIGVYLAKRDLQFSYAQPIGGDLGVAPETRDYRFELHTDDGMIQVLPMSGQTAQTPAPPNVVPIPSGTVVKLAVRSSDGNPIQPKSIIWKFIFNRT